MAKKTKKAAPQSRETAGIKSFLDMIAPSVVKFEPDHFICGNTFRCVWALREYPTQTDEQAILRHLGEKDGITLRIYTRQVTPAEEKRIIQNAANKNRMSSSNTNDLQQTITAESNLQDVASLVASMHRNREPLLHCAVYIELTASDYKDFSDAHIDTIEIMVSKLYAKWGITERSNFRRMRPEDYPILSDLYDLIEEEFKSYDPNAHLLYTEKLLQEVLLGLHSMCKGSDAQFFNGHTNITSSRFLVFGVKGMLSAAKNVRNAMLFNVLSFMSDKLLTVGNTVAALDELYIWLSNPTAIEYIRNCLKRVRKKESAMLLASQNLEDFDQEQVREMTKPLFSIPPHQFLFNAGSIDKRSYMEMLQLDEAEYNLIKFPQRGVCLYKCGNERYLLEVHAPAYKEKLFGTAGGR